MIRLRLFIAAVCLAALAPVTGAEAADGRVWVHPFRNRHQIDVNPADGTLQRTIRRRYESLARTEWEFELARRFMTPAGGRNRRTWNVVVEPTVRDIMQMHIAADGRLWVLSSRGAHPAQPSVHSIWDVFDAEGGFAQEVALACAGQAIGDKVFFPSPNPAVLVKNHLDALLAFRGGDPAPGQKDAEEEAAPIEVICYRLTP